MPAAPCANHPRFQTLLTQRRLVRSHPPHQPRQPPPKLQKRCGGQTGRVLSYNLVQSCHAAASTAFTVHTPTTCGLAALLSHLQHWWVCCCLPRHSRARQQPLPVQVAPERHLQGHLDGSRAIVTEEDPVRPAGPDCVDQLLSQLQRWSVGHLGERIIAVPYHLF